MNAIDSGVAANPTATIFGKRDLRTFNLAWSTFAS
jgi:hypothetical protein